MGNPHGHLSDQTWAMLPPPEPSDVIPRVRCCLWRMSIEAQNRNHGGRSLEAHGSHAKVTSIPREKAKKKRKGREDTHTTRRGVAASRRRGLALTHTHAHTHTRTHTHTHTHTTYKLAWGPTSAGLVSSSVSCVWVISPTPQVPARLAQFMVKTSGGTFLFKRSCWVASMGPLGISRCEPRYVGIKVRR